MISNLVDGRLPPGRYSCDIAEVRRRFGGSSRREKLVDDLELAIEVLRGIVGVVPCVWVGGSFVSGKAIPSDIDAVFLVEEDHLTDAVASDPANNVRLGEFARSGLKRRGVEVDSYLLAWRPNPSSQPRDNGDLEYLRARGYWDDFWLRERAGAPQPVREDALPMKGYLEVMVDGFR